MPDDYKRVPGHPELIGSRVYSPDVGRGWLGYVDGVSPAEFIFVEASLDVHRDIQYTEILTVQERSTSELWLVFVDEISGSFNTFLLGPDEDRVIFQVPRRVQQLLECL
jgi:hypothetical protein